MILAPRTAPRNRLARAVVHHYCCGCDAHSWHTQTVQLASVNAGLGLAIAVCGADLLAKVDALAYTAGRYWLR